MAESNEPPQPPTATVPSSSTPVNMTPQMQGPTHSGIADRCCRSTRLKRVRSGAHEDGAYLKANSGGRAKKPRWSQIIPLKVAPHHLARLADGERIANFLAPSTEEEIPPLQDDMITANADEEHVPPTSTDEGDIDGDNIVVKRHARFDPPSIESRQKTDRDALSRPFTDHRESASSEALPLTFTAASPKQPSAVPQGSGVWNSPPWSSADERRPHRAVPCNTPAVQPQSIPVAGHARSGERTTGANDTRAMLRESQQVQERTVSYVSTSTARPRTRRRRRNCPPRQVLPQMPLQPNMCYQAPMPGTIAPPTLIAPQQVAHLSHTQSQILLHQRQHPQQEFPIQPGYRYSIPDAVQPQQTIYQPFRTPPTIPSDLSPAAQFTVRQSAGHDSLSRLASKEAELRESGTLSSIASGRIALLQEAVCESDWFYQVLSQLFCLRTINPRLLHQFVGETNGDGWECLTTVLYSNHSLRKSKGLVEFFANFPEPIKAIYSRQNDSRKIYDKTVPAIKACLDKLAHHWDQLIHTCETQRAPPLVQDLHDRLGLRTTTLQSAVFRAFARMIYDPDSVEAIEKIHHLDQASYRSNHRRSPTEMRDAYGVLISIFTSYQRWAMLSNQPHFSLPPRAVNFFQQVPLGMASGQHPQDGVHEALNRPAQVQAVAQYHERDWSDLQAHDGQFRRTQRQHSNQMSAQLTHLQADRSVMQAPSASALNRGSESLFTEAGKQSQSHAIHSRGSGRDLHQSNLRSRDLGLAEHINTARINFLEQIPIEIIWNCNLEYSDHLSMGVCMKCETVRDFFSLVEDQMPGELRAGERSSRVQEVIIKALPPLKGNVVMPRITRHDSSGRAALRAVMRKLESQPPDEDFELQFWIVWEKGSR